MFSYFILTKFSNKLKLSEVTSFDDLLRYVLKDGGRYHCTLCNLFTHKWKDNVKNHVEAKHFNGAFVHTCDMCGLEFGTKYKLAQHRSKAHKKEKILPSYRFNTY